MSNEVEIRITSKNTASAGFKQVEQDAERSGKKIERSWQGVEAETEKLAGKVRELTLEFEKTGDVEVYRELSDTKRALAGLATVKKELRSLKNDADDAGDGIGMSFEKAGSRGGSGMANRIRGALSKLPVSVSPIGAAIGASLAAAILPAVGGAISAGGLLVVGGGVLAAGIKSAAKDSAVKAAWKEVGKQGSESFKDFGTPFRAPLIRAAKTFGDMLDRIAPSLNRIGKTMAPVIDKLAPGLAEMAERSMPGIEKAVEASVPLFETLASKLPKVGDTISSLLESFSNEGATEFFSDALDGTLGLIKGLGKLVGKLSEMYSSIKDTVGPALSDLNDTIKDNRRQLSRLGDAISFVCKLIGSDWKIQFKSAVVVLKGLIRAVGLVVDAFDWWASRVKHNAHAVRSTLSNSVAFIKSIPGRVSGALSRTFHSLISAASNARSRVSSAMSGVVGAARNTVSRLSGVLRNAFSALPAAARSAVSSARNILSGIIGYASSIVSRVRSTVSSKLSNLLSGLPGFAHGGVVGAATGGARSGLIMAGEQGRELIRVPAGSQVIPHGQTERMMQQSSGSSQVATLEISTDGTRVGDLLVEILRASIKKRGGNVQVILAGRPL